jgi:hypothetical protein
VLAAYPYAGRTCMTEGPVCGVEFQWSAVTAHMEGTALLICSGAYLAFLPAHFAPPWVVAGAMRALALDRFFPGPVSGRPAAQGAGAGRGRARRVLAQAHTKRWMRSGGESGGQLSQLLVGHSERPLPASLNNPAAATRTAAFRPNLPDALTWKLQVSAVRRLPYPGPALRDRPWPF